MSHWNYHLVDRRVHLVRVDHLLADLRRVRHDAGRPAGRRQLLGRGRHDAGMDGALAAAVPYLRGTAAHLADGAPLISRSGGAPLGFQRSGAFALKAMSDTAQILTRTIDAARADARAGLRRPAEAARHVAGGVHRPGRRADRAGPRSIRSAAVLAVLAIALGSGAAGAINMWYERDLDALMARTAQPAAAGRPCRARRRAGPRRAAVDLLGPADGGSRPTTSRRRCSLAAILFYVFVYTIWLKRRTPQNIVIGGAAGAFPPMIGWAAVDRRRLGRRHRALPADLPVDAAALLGAGALSQRRLSPRRRADAAGGGRPARDQAADAALHAGAGAGGAGADPARRGRLALRRAWRWRSASPSSATPSSVWRAAGRPSRPRRRRRMFKLLAALSRGPVRGAAARPAAGGLVG